MRSYHIVLTRNPDGGSWEVDVPALSCYASADTVEQAIENARTSIAEWLKMLVEDGDSPPDDRESRVAVVEVDEPPAAFVAERRRLLDARPRMIARYSVLLQPSVESGGFTVTVPELPGVVTQGDTFDEALAMAREAILLMVESMQKDGEDVPLEDAPPLLATVDIDIPAAPYPQPEWPD